MPNPILASSIILFFATALTISRLFSVVTLFQVKSKACQNSVKTKDFQCQNSVKTKDFECQNGAKMRDFQGQMSVKTMSKSCQNSVLHLDEGVQAGLGQVWNPNEDEKTDLELFERFVHDIFSQKQLAQLVNTVRHLHFSVKISKFFHPFQPK